jgi:hypothetical protein
LTRATFQTISGLILAVGLLVFGWQVGGRGPVDCAMVGSGLQAVGVLVELWAVLLIVWAPWVRPKVSKAFSSLTTAANRFARKLRERHDTRPKRVEVGMAVEADSAGSLKLDTSRAGHGTIEAEEDRVEQLSGRLDGVEQRLGEAEVRTARQLDSLRTELRHESEKATRAVDEQLTEIETQAIRVRVNDALRLLLGIFLTVVGTTWSTLC